MRRSPLRSSGSELCLSAVKVRIRRSRRLPRSYVRLAQLRSGLRPWRNRFPSEGQSVRQPLLRSYEFTCITTILPNGHTGTFDGDAQRRI
jgi:hypothetical protein